MYSKFRSGWPVPGNVADSKSEQIAIKPVLPPSSPLKQVYSFLCPKPSFQNYSAVVARSTPRSSVSDVPNNKEPTPVLYSQKAASSLQSPDGKSSVFCTFVSCLAI